MANTVPLLSFLCGKEIPSVQDIQNLRCKLSSNGSCREIVEELSKHKLFVSDEASPRLTVREIPFTDFSQTNAFNTMIFGGFLNVSAIQYFYTKYRIRLRSPYLPLVVSTLANGKHTEFFPIELLNVCISE